ncbi:hypothetical protein HK097_001298 [Rhizophlyctis rosea]|uniref:Uncharacterized protein n=1 Tax=Rhizophlyctis rosea TaxID=64517 RepID=A0AAD5S5T5_9FUNG|nr:hypothetical protein HK097_001298 [Rhizophlyctis rosea]
MGFAQLQGSGCSDLEAKGCLPVLYGAETWRDIALLHLAWSKPWVPRDEDYVVEEAPAHLLREEAGLFRTLVGVLALKRGADRGRLSYDYIDFPDGRVLLRQWREFGGPSRLQNVFYPPLPYNSPTTTLAHQILYTRPTAIATITKFGKRSVTTVQNPETSEAVHTYTGIDLRLLCGDICVDYNKGHIMSLNPRSKINFTIPRATSFTVNETLLAYITATPRTIHLIRLSDQTQIASHRLPQPADLLAPTHLTMHMSRFFLFVEDVSVKDVVSVYSLLDLKHLYTIPTPHRPGWMSFQMVNDCSLGAGVDIAGDAFVLDPVEKTRRRLVPPDVGRGGEDISGVDGYFVVVREYESDGNGKRVGTVGKERILWRTVSGEEE